MVATVKIARPTSATRCESISTGATSVGPNSALADGSSLTGETYPCETPPMMLAAGRPRSDDLGPGPEPGLVLSALADEPGLACLWGNWGPTRPVHAF